MKISKLKINPNNPQKYTDEDIETLAKSIKDFPKMMFLRPMVYDPKTMHVLGGNKRLLSCQKLGMEEIPDEWTKSAGDLTADEMKRFIVQDNIQVGSWDWEILHSDWDSEELEEWGLDTSEFYQEEKHQVNATLSERFIIPPFSILDTKQGRWSDRKKWWLSLGIKSELGREVVSNAAVKTFKGSTQSKNKSDILNKQTSIFDPVLCELAYKWFNIPNGTILDPFAGGSVRGIVANYLGYEYFGNDLSKNQIEANRKNAKEVLNNKLPVWTTGDSRNIDNLLKGKYDMIFTCPPYADLEVYSKDKADISNMNYEDFKKAYKEIIKKSCEMLKYDRFAVCVVGDVRDKKGFYKNLVSDTIMAFWNNGVILYNEMILATQIGTTGLTTSRNFPLGRKVGKVHQNVLVFYKGDPKKIRDNYPDLDLSYMSELEE